jgi:hypothetical protein
MSKRKKRRKRMRGKRGTIAVMAAGVLLLSGCGGMTLPGFGTGPSANDEAHFIYQGHDFGPGRDAEYQQGVKDGCRTAGGDYAKNHALYQGSPSYKAGWEHGRLHCKK